MLANVNCTCRTLVGDVRELDLARAREHRAQQVIDRTVASRAEAHIAGLRACECDQFADTLHGQGTVHGDDKRYAGQRGQRSEALLRIPGQSLVQARVDRMGAYETEQPGVAVRRGLGDKIVADVAAGTRTVVDEYLLAPAIGQLLADDARQRVGGTAWRLRHHQPDRTCRPRLWLRRGRCGRRHLRQQRQGRAADGSRQAGSSYGPAILRSISGH
jgi:hypothetical protein